MLPQSEVVRGIERELEDFAGLVRSLDEREWGRPSRCEGWTVGDVAGHLAGAFADITSGRIEGQGTPEVSERQAAERRGHTASAVADELDEVAKVMVAMVASFDKAAWASTTPGGYELTLGQAMESLWCGAYVHADDIRAAIGRSSERGPGLRASVDYVAEVLTLRNWGPATLALEGMDEVSVGGDGRGETRRRVTADPLGFLLAATGRADSATLGLDASVNVFAATSP
jgi:uncharacterized protein (TIGR03083 family)